MADNTNIEWADSTFNPFIGCTKISPACDNCYAEALMDKRMNRVKWGAGQPRVRTSAGNWKKPLQWNEKRFMECGSCGWRGELEAELCGCPSCKSIHDLKDARRRVFCASLADVFDNEVPVQWRRDLFDLIEKTSNLDWLLLTKRIGNAARMIEGTNFPDHRAWPWPNVWIGATICNQEEADRDIPKLLAVPAAVRFLSIEPMLGRVDLCETFGMWWNQTMQCFESSSRAGFNRNPINLAERAIDWVIVGGESGPEARPMVLGWAKDIVRQCKAAGVPVLVKQLGANPMNREGDKHQISDKAGRVKSEWPEVLRVQEYPQ